VATVPFIYGLRFAGLFPLRPPAIFPALQRTGNTCRLALPYVTIVVGYSWRIGPNITALRSARWLFHAVLRLVGSRFGAWTVRTAGSTFTIC